MSSPSRLEEKIGYRFEDCAWLERACTHKSAGSDHNERLEFLGDAVLGSVVAQELFDARDSASEHDLTLMRASLVKKSALAAMARDLHLGEHLKLGPGELKSGGRDRESILADALEAVIGSVAVDGGYQAAAEVVLRLVRPLIARLDDSIEKDPKTQLQELLQGRHLNLPRYEVVSTEEHAHSRLYWIECAVQELGLTSRARASTRREAEKLAASALLGQIET
ncbi:MAG: ribonuclease III [Gammaproteobacteria bacterium]|nr:ribonuclease III [Gammaproteobacteria bacterium]